MRLRTLVPAIAFVIAAPLHAQGWMAEMHRDLNDVQDKMIKLANAMPDASLDWKPGTAANVRTMREVFLHVASDNYLIGAMLGKAPPATTGISTADPNSATTYEKKKLTKAQIVTELTASFTFIHQALALTTDANSTENIKFFGQDWSRQRAVVLTVTHLHEHLGQSIAYARGNNVVPPWSK